MAHSVTFNLSIRSILSHASYLGAGWVIQRGDRAYMTSNNAASFTIFDVSDPDAPEQIGQVIDETWLGGAEGFRLTADGNYAIVVAETPDAVTVIDLTDETAPTVLTHLTNAVIDCPEQLELVGNTAFVLNYGVNKFVAVDVTTPGSPTIKCSVDIAFQAQFFSIKGNYAYIIGLDQIQVVNITNVNAGTPSMTAASAANWTTLNAGLSGFRGTTSTVITSGASTYLVVGMTNSPNTDGHFTIIDITTPGTLGTVSVFNTGHEVWVTAQQDRPYIVCDARAIDSLYWYDFTVPTAPVLLASLTDSTNLDGIDDLWLGDDRLLYVSINDGHRFAIMEFVDTAVGDGSARTYYAQSSATWTGAGWNTAADGSGASGSPIAGDTAYLNGKTVTNAVLPRIPPGGGSLALLSSAGGTDARLLLLLGADDMDVSFTALGQGQYNSHVYGVLMAQDGNAAGGTLTINCDVTGGDFNYSPGVYSTASHAIIVNGDVTGGTGTACNGITLASSSTGALTITGDVTGGTHYADCGAGVKAAGTGLVTVNGNVTGGSHGCGIISGSVNGSTTPSSDIVVNLTDDQKILGGPDDVGEGITLSQTCNLTVNGGTVQGGEYDFAVCQYSTGSWTFNNCNIVDGPPTGATALALAFTSGGYPYVWNPGPDNYYEFNAGTAESPTRVQVGLSMTTAEHNALMATAATVAALGAATTVIPSPITASGSKITVIRGDTYGSGGWTAPAFTNSAGGWLAGNLAGATITLTVFDKAGTVKLTTAAVVDSATSPQSLHVDLTATQTASLSRGLHSYTLKAVKGSVVETIASGSFDAR